MIYMSLESKRKKIDNLLSKIAS
jgi:hypothetical protein